MKAALRQSSTLGRTENGDYSEAQTAKLVYQATQQHGLKLRAFARHGYPGKTIDARLLPELHTVGYWDAPRDQFWGSGWRCLDSLALTFTARGEVSLGVNDHTISLRSGCLSIIRPGQRHRLGAPFITASRLHWLILDLGLTAHKH